MAVTASNLPLRIKRFLTAKGISISDTAFALEIICMFDPATMVFPTLMKWDNKYGPMPTQADIDAQSDVPDPLILELDLKDVQKLLVLEERELYISLFGILFQHLLLLQCYIYLITWKFQLL